MTEGRPGDIPYNPRDYPAHLRATDDERDQIVQVVQAAMADGRLSVDELDTRLAQVYAAKTHGDLVAASHDLKEWQVAPPPPPMMAPPPPYYVVPSPPTGNSARTITPALLLCFFTGIFGVHRFYAGKIGSGMAMLLLTLSFVGAIVSGIWTLVDFITLAVGNFRDGDGRPIRDWT